jgi:hypothetical protein
MIIMGAAASSLVGNGVSFENQSLCDRAADAILHSIPVEQAKQTQIICAPQGNVYQPPARGK